jgi:hypothetical protein
MQTRSGTLVETDVDVEPLTYGTASGAVVVSTWHLAGTRRSMPMTGAHALQETRD